MGQSLGTVSSRLTNTSRFSSPWQMPALIRILFEEWDNSLTASRRYEELRRGGGTALRLLARGSVARQVFTEIYAVQSHEDGSQFNFGGLQ